MFFSRSLSCYFVAQLVKKSTCNVGDLGLSLGWEDPLEKGKATHSSILAWRILWTKSMVSQRIRHDWATFTFTTSYFALKTLGLGSVAGIHNQFSRSVMSHSLWPHGLQHTRPPHPSPIPEFTLTHVHWVGDATQPSPPLLSPSSPAFNLFQHQGLFKWVSSLQQEAKVLEFQLQHQSFQWIFRTDFR